MELHVLDEKTMREYTDDEKLIEKLDLRLRWFSVVENMAELVSYPMEYFTNIPFITVEECQLIDEVQKKEGIKIREWAQKPENKELDNEANQPECC